MKSKDIEKIQSLIRGKQVRDKYQINPLTDVEAASCLAYVVGNDPVLPTEISNYAEPKDKIAVIATSCLRAVALACHLGNKNQLPKIILVDNSKQVIKFWEQLRIFMENSGKTEADFFENLPEFLSNNQDLYRNITDEILKNGFSDQVELEPQDINVYFEKMIKEYGYDYVKAVILHAAVIRQSWADADTFTKIKNITDYLKIEKIVMYPSNIVPSIDSEIIKEQILNNIASISPVLAIHTNICEKHHRPETTLLMTEHDPAVVSAKLSHSKTCVEDVAQKALEVLDEKILVVLQQAETTNLLPKSFNEVSGNASDYVASKKSILNNPEASFDNLTLLSRPAYLAAKHGYVNVLKSMLENGIDPNIILIDTNAKTLMETAIENNQPEIIKLLLQYGVKGDLLHYAAEHNLVEIIENELENGADPNKFDSKGRTPLYVAVQSGNNIIVDKL